MSHKTKFYKFGSRQPTPLEDSVAQALHQLEGNATELKIEVKDIFITGAKEIETVVKGKKGKNVILVFVPVPCLKTVQKIHAKLVPELEKKLKNPVLFVAKRTIQSKWLKTHKSQTRPRSRTLTAVHDAILDDLVLPGNIVGRRFRHRLDGSVFQKVFLDQADEAQLKDKVDVISYIYKKLTTKEVQFEFKPEWTFLSTKK